MMKTRRRALLAALMITTMLGAGAAVRAQPGLSMWDPAQLPETRGTVKQYTLTPRGDVDGLILIDGTEVKLPPHLSAQIVFAIRPGDTVTVRGLRARALPLVDAASITNVASGRTVVDNGPPGGPDRPMGERTFTGMIQTVLHGKRGEVNGALLDNGTMIRLPPPEAERLAALIQPGQPVAVRGSVLETALGTVVRVRAIGRSPGELTEFILRPFPGPKGGPKGGPKRG